MAIAFDAAGTAAQTLISNTLTISHTCSGSDRILFVNAHGAWATSGTITGVTYNGVSMTKINNNSPQANTYLSLWYLVAPATGANNIVITASSTGRLLVQGASASYTGASQTGIPDSQNKNTGVANTLTVATTVVAANSWVVACGSSGASSITASTGVTSRSELDSANASVVLGDSNGGQSAGSYSSTITAGAVDSIGLIVASFAPAVAAGPTNLKSLDTNVKANIKSYNGNVIANIKSINSNT